MGRVSTCQKNCNTIDLRGAQVNKSWYVSLEWYFIYLLFLASVHGFMYETSVFFFYSVITFSYTKCFVHSYTVDVVFTLSYWYIISHIV